MAEPTVPGIVYRTVHTVRQTTDGVDIVATSGKYDEASIVVDDPPRAQFVVHDPSGALGATVLKAGKEFSIKRSVNGTQGEIVFRGIIETTEATDGPKGTMLTVRGVHKGYKMLQQHICDTYDYDEDGNPSTVRDAVTVNPWNFFIYRKAGAAIDLNGDTLPIDGVTVKEVFQCLIGSRHILQIDFEDNSMLRASQVYTSTNKVQVYRDGGAGALRPALSRVRAPGVRTSGTSTAAGRVVLTDSTASFTTTVVAGDVVRITSGNYAGAPGGSAVGASSVVDIVASNTQLTLTPGFPDIVASGAGYEVLRNGQFVAGGSVDTIPLDSGDPNVEKSPDINAATLYLIGFDDGQDPTVAATRDAREASPTYTSLQAHNAKTLIKLDDGVTSTGLTQWEYNFNSLPASTIKTSLGFRINLPGAAGDTTATRIEYAKADWAFGGASDTGLIDNGSIDSYNYTNPNPFRNDIDPSKWVETDFSEKNRLVAAEELRQQTESDSTNQNPHWDFWIDADLIANFRQRRGVDITNHDYSFPAGNLRELSRERVGNELAYQTIGYGAGSGVAQTRIVSKEEFSTGGLYDSDRDPAVGAKYGELARVMQFVDAGETSAEALRRKARAFHKLHRDPIENYKLEITPEFIRYFTVGDAIRVKNLRTTTNGLLRVIELSRAWDGGSMEKLTVTVGQVLDSFARLSANQAQKHDTLSTSVKPDESITSLSGEGIRMEKDYYGVFAFAIHDGASVDRVLLRLTTIPWHTYTNSGISQFTGDVPVPGAPVYAANVQFAVDPAVDANGIPTTFTTDANPLVFGTATGSQSVEVDVTGSLAVGDNLIIKTGEHRVYFKAATSTNNQQALGVVSVTPLLKFKKA